MNELLLHVGVHKTGSSSIQNTLDLNRKRLLEIGVKLFSGRNHSELYRAFTDTPESFHRYYRSWGKNANQLRLRTQLRDYFLGNKGIDHLVSGEDICLLSQSALSTFETFLRRECGISKVTVICFLREPLDYLNSSLQQYIKPGLVTLDEITGNTLNSYRLQGCPGFSGGLQNVLSQIYFPIPRKLVEVFGEENVRFVKFETAITTGLAKSVLENFECCKDFHCVDAGASNTSMSHEACLLLAEHNNRNPLLTKDKDVNNKRVSNRIASIIRSIPGGPARLVNPSHLDLGKINLGVDQINSIANFDILTPINQLSVKYNGNEFFNFSRESATVLESLIDIPFMKLSGSGTTITTDQLTTINKALEKRHKTRWQSLFYRYTKIGSLGN